jgi:hypothetical protein
MKRRDVEPVAEEALRLLPPERTDPPDASGLCGRRWRRNPAVRFRS